MVKKCNLVVFNAEMVSIGAKKNELLRPSTLVGASQSNSMKSQSVDLLVERLRRLGSARSARKLSLSIKFQFIGGMKVGEPSADGRGSAPPELAEQQARAYVKPSPAPIIPYTQAIRFTVLSEYKAPKRSMPLKTVFCFRSSENVPWHL